jgi:hypothetical protein
MKTDQVRLFLDQERRDQQNDETLPIAFNCSTLKTLLLCLT